MSGRHEVGRSKVGRVGSDAKARNEHFAPWLEPARYVAPLPGLLIDPDQSGTRRGRYILNQQIC